MAVVPNGQNRPMVEISGFRCNRFLSGRQRVVVEDDIFGNQMVTNGISEISGG